MDPRVVTGKYPLSAGPIRLLVVDPHGSSHQRNLIYKGAVDKHAMRHPHVPRDRKGLGTEWMHAKEATAGTVGNGLCLPIPHHLLVASSMQ